MFCLIKSTKSYKLCDLKQQHRVKNFQCQTRYECTIKLAPYNDESVDSKEEFERVKLRTKSPMGDIIVNPKVKFSEGKVTISFEVEQSTSLKDIRDAFGAEGEVRLKLIDACIKRTVDKQGTMQTVETLHHDVTTSGMYITSEGRCSGMLDLPFKWTKVINSYGEDCRDRVYLFSSFRLDFAEKGFYTSCITDHVANHCKNVAQTFLTTGADTSYVTFAPTQGASLKCHVAAVRANGGEIVKDHYRVKSSEEGVRLMVEYVYTGQFPTSNQRFAVVMDVLRLSKQFNMGFLTKAIEELFLSTTNKVWFTTDETLKLYQDYRPKDEELLLPLANKALDILKERCAELRMSGEFQQQRALDNHLQQLPIP